MEINSTKSYFQPEELGWLNELSINASFMTWQTCKSCVWQYIKNLRNTRVYIYSNNLKVGPNIIN